MGKSKEIIKEFNIAKAIAIFLMIAIHSMFAIYNYNNEIFANTLDYLASPFCAPTFMFILGANIVLSSHNSSKELFIRGFRMFLISIVFNIICHALPFFLIDYKMGIPNYVENSLHWIFAVDILTFAGLAFMFFSLVKKFNISNKKLIIFAIITSFVSTLLIKYCQIDFNTHPFFASLTSLFYSSSITGYFSFLGWIIFPISGYIFIQYLLKTKDKNKFYNNLGIYSIIIYLVMIVGSLTIFKDAPLVYFAEEYSYYYMNTYSALGNVAFCLGWISILYFVSKKIKKWNGINRLSSNLNTIYIVQWFIINYLFVLPFNGELKVGTMSFILFALCIIVLSDISAILYKKYKEWKSS